MRKLAMCCLVILVAAALFEIPVWATPSQTADGDFQITDEQLCPLGYRHVAFELTGAEINGLLCLKPRERAEWDAFFDLEILDDSGTCEGIAVYPRIMQSVLPPYGSEYAKPHSNTCTGGLAGLHLDLRLESASMGSYGTYSARYHFDP